MKQWVASPRGSAGSLAVRMTALGAALAFAAGAAGSLDEAGAVNRLQQQLKRSADYRIHGECLSLLVEEREPAFFGIAVYEKHGDGCPGDPATMPVLDRFQVYAATAALRRYDVMDDRYVDWMPDTAR